MKKINVKGAIIPNDYKWFYDYFEMDSTSPGDIQKFLEPDPNEEIEVYVNSPGGIIEAGTEIYTMLKSHLGKVNIYVVGEACSAASMIAMASNNVQMAPTALLMIHCVSSGGRGNAADMQHIADVLRTADEAIANAYVSKTGLNKTEILDLMQKETWFTADQAKEKGFIDKIMFENEENPDFQMAASNFKLPSLSEMQKVKAMIEKQNLQNESAFFMSKIRLLKLKRSV